MEHHNWLTQCHTAAFIKRRLANLHELFDESLRDFACVCTLTEALPTKRRSCVQKWRVNATERRRFYFYERPFLVWIDSRQAIPGVATMRQSRMPSGMPRGRGMLYHITVHPL